MNDRLMIAAMVTNGMLSSGRLSSLNTNRIAADALLMADALLAAAAREPSPVKTGCDDCRERAEAAEARAADLQAKLDEAARLARETAGEAMHIVIPEADWKRMVELSIDSQVGHRPAIGAEIKAIIEKVKAANG